MFKFKFLYNDRREVLAVGIDKVLYVVVGMEIKVEGDDILTHQFPLNSTLHLYGKNQSYTISKDGLVSIHVTRDEG